MIPTSATYAHILAAVYGRPWAIYEPTMRVILEVLDARARGEKFSDEEIAARVGAAREAQGDRQGKRQTKSIGVVPIYGVLSPRGGLMANSSGGSSVESVRQDFRSMMANEDVSGIVFDIDSPGGAVDGIPELASEIMDARGQKPMIAVSNTMMASAALWLGAAADEIWATKSAGVGSIGVIRTHEDHSEADAKEGVKYTYIHSSPFKAEGNRHGPLSAEAMDFAQDEVNHFDAMFTDFVANARGVESARVRSDYGQGRLLHADAALGAGLVDQIGSVEQAVQAIATGTSRQSGQSTPAGHSAVTLALSTESVLDLITQERRDALPFGKRLTLVSDEVEALVAHARVRRDMRVQDGEGRPLSAETRESLSRLAGKLTELVSDPETKGPVSTQVSTGMLHLMLRTYEEI